MTAGCNRSDSQPKSLQPNIILISIDTLRADHLHCYGYNRKISPTIDSLAKNGVLFERAFAQANWTLPSHVSIFASLYPSSHGVTTNKKKISYNTVLLAQTLRNEGYRTASFNAGGNVSAKYGFSRGFDLWEEIPFHRGDMKAMTSRLICWLKKNHKNKFFVFLHTYEVHTPYHAPAAYRKTYVHFEEKVLEMKRNIFYKIVRDEPLSPEETEFLRALVDCLIHKNIRWEFIKNYREYAANTNPEDMLPARVLLKRFKRAVRRIRRNCLDIYHYWSDLKFETFGYTYIIDNYDAEIRFTDRQLHRLVNFLHQMGLKKRTLIILTSDHGEEFLDHRNMRHGVTSYNEVIRVPLVFYYPGSLPSGLVLGDNVALIDLVPTIHDILGIPLHDQFQGVSLLPLIRGRRRGDRLIFCEHLDSERAVNYKPVVVIHGDWKYHHDLARMGLRNPDDPSWDPQKNIRTYLGDTKPQELYHLIRDFQERVDLCKESPEVVDKLSATIKEHLAEAQACQGKKIVLDKVLKNQLMDLGYIE